MQLSDFDYNYPCELVAQHPLPQRDDARMMVVDRASAKVAHNHIRQLPEFLRAGDVVVINDTKVIPARLIGQKESGGSVEVVLLHTAAGPATGGYPVSAKLRRDSLPPASPADNTWWCLTSHTKRLKPGMRLQFPSPPGEGQGEGEVLLSATVCERNGDEVLLAFEAHGSFEDILHKIGLPPLPPYIVRNTATDYSPEDRERYQTVFARHAGSAAAPTAGLHLTGEMLKSLRARGVHIAEVTLHVGRDTFQPVRTKNIAEHRMHGEWCEVPDQTAHAVTCARRDGRRVIAVGTTSVRTLESFWNPEKRQLNTGGRETRMFITPGYRFQVVDGMLTNFHQPRSTLLMLVSAFLGRERVLSLYTDAIRKKYRLFSFGDCMVIL